MSYTDRRQTQTAEQYAADDLETMREAKRYGAHLFRLFRPYVGRRVLEVGCGIGTMSRRLTEVADAVLGIEPNPHCAGLVRDEMHGEPKSTCARAISRSATLPSLPRSASTPCSA